LPSMNSPVGTSTLPLKPAWLNSWVNVAIFTVRSRS
jgi:hypothetical protein